MMLLWTRIIRKAFDNTIRQAGGRQSRDLSDGLSYMPSGMYGLHTMILAPGREGIRERQKNWPANITGPLFCLLTSGMLQQAGSVVAVVHVVTDDDAVVQRNVK